MIKIGFPYKEKSNDAIKLCFELIENDKLPHVIWFEFDKKYENYLVTERIDGIVVNLLYYCMEHGHDIVSECPISEKLYFQLTNFLVPSISQNLTMYSDFSINAPLDNTYFNNECRVGTGISCGVDSFYTVCKNHNSIIENYNITHLTFFNAGASGNFGGEKARQLYQERLKEVEPCTKDLNLPMLAVDTNINEFLMERHIFTHTVRALAIPLYLQKLFSVYYYSSGSAVWEFEFQTHPTYYEIFILDCLSTENLKFYSVGTETDRLGKVKYIMDDENAHRYLNVCVAEEKNCCKCEKCRRTIIQLFALNKLDSFSEVFDLKYIYENIDEYILFALLNRKISYYHDALKLLEDRNYKISSVVKIKYIPCKFLYVSKKYIRKNKIIRKILGKTPI